MGQLPPGAADDERTTATPKILYNMTNDHKVSWIQQISAILVAN